MAYPISLSSLSDLAFCPRRLTRKLGFFGYPLAASLIWSVVSPAGKTGWERGKEEGGRGGGREVRGLVFLLWLLFCPAAGVLNSQLFSWGPSLCRPTNPGSFRAAASLGLGVAASPVLGRTSVFSPCAVPLSLLGPQGSGRCQLFPEKEPNTHYYINSAL